MAGNPAIDDEEETGVEDTSNGFNMDILDMSDDDLAGMTNDQIAEASKTGSVEPEDKPPAEIKSDAANEDDELDIPPKKGDDDDEPGKPEAKAEDEDPDKKTEVLDEEAGKNPEAEAAKTEPEADGKEKAKKADLEVKVDYKQEYEKLLKPFKANGRQIQVDNVDDAVTLMKMGANYNKKMAALKPTLKIVKMLEKHDLLDETKLSHLIDVAAHDPSAISKLLKDAKLDPLDIDTDDKSTYEAKDHSVNDKQFELDQIIDNIKDNESFPKTIDTISNQWDAQSKKIVLNDPRIITVIDDHIQSGIFDQIVSVMDKERLLGRMTDKPDIVAYQEIGAYLTSQGTFKKEENAAAQTAEPTAEELAATKEREDKRAAAASTRSTKISDKASDFDPLSMPDEEFEKLTANGLYR
jgi:hypothetical protein